MMQFKRPILIGGLGLSASLWLLDIVNQSLWDGSALMGAIAVGSGLWWWRRSAAPAIAEATTTTAPEVNRALVEQRLQRIDAVLATWATEISTLDAAQQPLLQQKLEQATTQRQQLAHSLTRQHLSVAIQGNKAVGKTALFEYLTQHWHAPDPYTVALQEHSSLAVASPDTASPGTASPDTVSSGTASSGTAFPDTASPDTASPDTAALDTAAASSPPTSGSPPTSDANPLSTVSPEVSTDLVIFLTTGDLTESEFQQLQGFAQQGQRFVVGLNKQDIFPPMDRAVVQQQLKMRLAQLQVESPVMALAAAPKPIKLRRHQADGSVTETSTQPAPDVDEFSQYLSHLVQHDAAQLVLATTLRQAEALRRSLQGQVNALKRDRALPIITQYQWLAGAAAFANPVPTLDLVATAAITAQLVVDVGDVYGQKFTVEQAKTAAGTLANLVIKLGLVELSTEALAGLLKSNSTTYIAGGLLQGVSAAYLTRLAGLGLVDWFETQSLADHPQTTFDLSLAGLGQRLSTLFDQTKGSVLPQLVHQGLTRWQRSAGEGASSASSLVSADPAPVEFSTP